MAYKLYTCKLGYIEGLKPSRFMVLGYYNPPDPNHWSIHFQMGHSIAPGPCQSRCSCRLDEQCSCGWFYRCLRRGGRCGVWTGMTCVYMYPRGSNKTSIFEGQPNKTRPELQSKQGVIWVLGIYIYYIFSRESQTEPSSASTYCMGYIDPKGYPNWMPISFPSFILPETNSKSPWKWGAPCKRRFRLWKP